MQNYHKEDMNVIKLQKGINYLSITISIVLATIFFINLLSNPIFKNDSYFYSRLPHIISIPLLIIFSIIISIRTNQQKGVLLFALFLSLISSDWLSQFLRMMNPNWIPFFGLVFLNSLTGTIYIKALQSFPRQISKSDIDSVFAKNKIASIYLNWAIKDYTWFIIPLFLIACSLLKVSEMFSDLFVLITALLCLYVNYKNSNALEKNKIIWLFWGLLSFTFLMIIITILFFSTSAPSVIVKLLFNFSLMFVLILSLVMSLFFSNTFDTGILIRRTIADGFLFIIIVLIYNTIEHYFLHWLSHKLEISDVILSSLLSGIFVLAFSPLHHKFMKFIEIKLKKNHVE